MTDRILTEADLDSYTVTHDGPVVRVAVVLGGAEGYGAAPDTPAGRDVALFKALRDLNRRLEKAAGDYRTEWSTLADRPEREIYVPEALRAAGPVEPATGECRSGGTHRRGTVGQWQDRCTRCGTRID